MAALSAGLRKNAFILSSLVSRDFKLKYRRSFLGVVWSVLNPLLMMIVMTVVFSFMFRFQIKYFALYLILGQILFNFMVASSTGGLTSILTSAALIKKIRIEKLIFPIEKVLSELVNLAFSLVAVPVVMLYYQVVPTWRLVFIPLLLIYLTLFCSGLATLLGSLAVFFRDVQHLWTVFTLMWTYLTPIFYPVTMLPQFLQQLERFNPMFRFITYFRDIVMNGVTPNISDNLICLATGVVMLAVGVLVFRHFEKRFILYV